MLTTIFYMSVLDTYILVSVIICRIESYRSNCIMIYFKSEFYLPDSCNSKRGFFKKFILGFSRAFLEVKKCLKRLGAVVLSIIKIVTVATNQYYKMYQKESCCPG